MTQELLKDIIKRVLEDQEEQDLVFDMVKDSGSIEYKTRTHSKQLNHSSLDDNHYKDTIAGIINNKQGNIVFTFLVEDILTEIIIVNRHLEMIKRSIINQDNTKTFLSVKRFSKSEILSVSVIEETTIIQTAKRGNDGISVYSYSYYEDIMKYFDSFFYSISVHTIEELNIKNIYPDCFQNFEVSTLTQAVLLMDIFDKYIEDLINYNEIEDFAHTKVLN